MSKHTGPADVVQSAQPVPGNAGAEFASASFKFHDGMPYETLVQIACRYYLFRRGGHNEYDHDRADRDADDRRIALEMTIKKLVAGDGGAGAAPELLRFDLNVEKGADKSLIVNEQRHQAGAVGGFVEIAVDHTEKMPDTAVWVFEGGGVAFNVQKDRIFSLFGADSGGLDIKDFSSRVSNGKYKDANGMEKQKKYATYLITPNHRDPNEADIVVVGQREQKATKNFAILDSFPTLRDELAALSDDARPTFRDYVGFEKKFTHNRENLVQEVLCRVLGLDQVRVRAVAEDRVRPILFSVWAI